MILLQPEGRLSTCKFSTRVLSSVLPLIIMNISAILDEVNLFQNQTLEKKIDFSK